MSAMVRVLAALAMIASAAARIAHAQPTEEPPALDMAEEVQRIAVTVKDMYGRQETKQIPITTFRPRGNGPFPLAIINHGRAPDASRARQGRQRYEDIARYLVAKGFVVMVPTRVGYGETYGEFDPESSGPCNAKNVVPMAEAVFTEVMATRDFARTLPFVDVSRWLVVGQSVGGFTAVVTVGKHPPGLIGGINFAGGTGGDPDHRPQDPCGPQVVGALWHNLAAGATVPMLWLYWQNDMYWGPRIPQRWAADWVAGGGKAEMHTLPPVGTNGHGGSGLDMDHWVPIADAFLAGLGFGKPGVIARPPPSGFASVNDVDKVPLPASARDGAYQRFLDAKTPRAFAIGPNAGGVADRHTHQSEPRELRGGVTLHF